MTIKDSGRDILVSNLMELLREYSAVQNSYDSSVNYVTSAGLDSFDIMNYVSEIELKYQISFEPIELSNEFFHTVDGLATLLFEKLKAK